MPSTAASLPLEERYRKHVLLTLPVSFFFFILHVCSGQATSGQSMCLFISFGGGDARTIGTRLVVANGPKRPCLSAGTCTAAKKKIELSNAYHFFLSMSHRLQLQDFQWHPRPL